MRAKKKSTNKKTITKTPARKNRSSPYNSKNLLILIPLTFVIAFTYYNQKPKSKNDSNCKKSISNSPSILAPSSLKNPNKTEIQSLPAIQATFTSVNLTTEETTSISNKVWGVNGAQARKAARNLDQQKLIADNSSDMSLQEKNPQCLRDELYHSSRLQIGPSYTRVNLKPAGHNSFNGNLWGAQGSYEYKPANDLYAGVTLTWSQGDLDGIAGSRYLRYIDTQERLGYTFASEAKKWLMTVFSGFGYRNMGHHYHSTTGDSIRFNYNEFYVPVGLISNYSCSSWFNWGLGVTWMPQVFPTVNITPTHGNNWSLSYRLANFLVEMPLDFAVTENRKFHISFNPFYQTWNDGHSTAKTSTGASLGLPSNDYNFWGANLNLGYYF